jgi:acetoacetate decarboxylase
MENGIYPLMRGYQKKEKMYRGNKVAEEHSSYLRENPPSAHVQNLNTFPVKFIHPINGRLPV